MKLNRIEVLPIRERVASEIRNAIFSGKFGPGYLLRQDSLAKNLGVSRMPVREALNVLAGEGLVEIRVNRGAIVQEISEEYIREHFDLRLILECEAVSRACENIDDTSNLEVIHKEQRSAIDNLNMEEVGLCNQSFHMYLWDHANNIKMKSILIQLWNGLSIGTVVLPVIHAERSYEEHSTIIKAINDNDSETARAVMQKHILRSMENMLMRTPER